VEQILHPYYDDVTISKWLFAEVIEGSSALFKFFVIETSSYSPLMNARINYHFNALNLGSLYRTQAINELDNIRWGLSEIFKRSNANEVQKHLETEFQSRFNNNINSWQTAMYQAMINSYWFCNGGFNNK
jgi:hypothetical protein